MAVTYPARPGWSARYSRFDGPRCNRCLHEMNRHFWWEKVGQESEIGCRDCLDGICGNRKVIQNVSAVNLCERCGALMLGKAVATLDVRTSPEAANEHIEICPGCVTSFMDWNHSATTPLQATPYRDAWKPETGKTESQLMLENGYCGVNHPALPGMCLRPKGHDGEHRDGKMVW